MRPALAAIGWIGEVPAGNRLRWTAPLLDEVEGTYRGLPLTATVERSNVTIPLFQPPPVNGVDIVGVPFPPNWFESEVSPLSLPLSIPSRYRFLKRVQLATFVYQGPATRMRVLDEANGTVVRERAVTSGETVWVKEPFIGELQFFAWPVTLVNLRFVDFYADHGLVFQPIARIAVAATVGQAMSWAYRRYSGSPTIEAADWAAVNALMTSAIASTPDTDQDALPLWQEFEIIQGARWEYAVALGFGFRDGPGAAPGAPADNIETSALLNGPGGPSRVYRVVLRYPNDVTLITNAAVVPSLVVPPLQPPVQLAHENSVVRLFGDSRYVVSTTIAWRVNDPRAIGMEAENQLGASPILGGQPLTESFSFRSRGPTDSAERTVLPRELEVRFYDVPLRIRARSTDGWDRVSPFSPWTGWVNPHFDHAPAPPPLLQARHRQDRVELIQGTGTPDIEEWTPDHAVANTPGSVVEIVRRIAQPAVVDLTVEAVRQIDQWRYEIEAAGVPNLERFWNGRIIAGRMRGRIIDVENTAIRFQVTADGAFGAELFAPGPATLQQDPSDPELFQLVGTVPAVELPPLFLVDDPLPAVGGTADLRVYAVRVRLGSIVGAIGNPVAALRQPPVPALPPPFIARLLGLDYYERTVVQLIFSAPLESGDYAVFFADGVFELPAFTSEAMPGSYEIQRPHHGTLLYETLPLPLPGVTPKSFTLGVQRVLSGGARSPFVLGTLTVPPLQGA